MAISFTNIPNQYSGSLNPNFVEMKSSLVNKKDLKIKFEYLNNGSNIIKPMYLTLDNDQRSFIDLNKIMNNYTKPFNMIERLGDKIIEEDFGSFKYDVKATETYVDQISMADHNWYSGSQIIITTVQPHNYNVGDVVYIEITDVINPHPPTTEYDIKKTLQGAKVVHQVLNLNQFTIKGFWPGSTDQTMGIVTYNDKRREISSTSSGLINRYIIYGDNTHDELYNDTSAFKTNNWSHKMGMNPIINRSYQEITIKEDEDFYLRFFDPQKTIKSIAFNDDMHLITAPETDVYQINLNPWVWNPALPQLKEVDVRIVDEFFNILYIKLTIDRKCELFNDKLIFVDRKGRIGTIYTTLDKKKRVTPNNDGHTYRKMYNKNYYINTQNNYSESIELNTNWLDETQYNYIKDLITSPYIWYVEDGKEPRLCKINDTQYEFISSLHYRYQQKITIELI